MKLRILNETGDTLLTDEPMTEGLERVKKISSADIKKEFDSLVKQGYTPVDATTKKILTELNKTSSVTMLYPIIGG